MTVLEDKKYFFSDDQFRFRECRATVKSLLRLKKHAKNMLMNFRYCALTSLDIEGAFDVASWDVMANIIKDLPLASYLRLI